MSTEMNESNPGSTPGNSEDIGESPHEDALRETPPSSEDDTSTSENTSPSPTEAAGREISIVLAGKAAAGKSSLARNILGTKLVNETSAKPKTKKCNTHTATKNGVTLIVTDTVGFLGDQVERSKEIRKLTEHTQSKPDILVYCIAVSLSAVFKDGNPDIMKSLHQAYGPDIWKHCIVALTFSNVALITLKSTSENDDQAISEYKSLLREYTTLFKKEVEKLNCGKLNMKTIFGYHKFSQDTIVAIPVGWKPDDPVLPELDVSEIPASNISEEIKNWNNILYIEMVRHTKPQRKKDLLIYRFGPTIVVGVVGGAVQGAIGGAGIGAGIGAIVGLVGGPVGLAVGAAIGAGVGGAVGAVVEGAAVGAIIAGHASKLKTS